MQNVIKCPGCGKEVEISEAWRHEWEEGVLASERAKHEQEKELARKQGEEKATVRIREELELKMKNSAEELEEERKSSKKLREDLSEMMKEMRELRRQSEDAKIELQKKLAESEEKIRQEAAAKAGEEHHLKDLEKDKVISDLKKQMEEMQRKLAQGSQQTQGEVMELELEQLLKMEFAADLINPVGKGVRGADVIQEVMDKYGNKCGSIMWESKNARWNDGWLVKLREDQRQVGAETAVVVTEHLPDGVKMAAYREGIWIVHRPAALGMAYALRANVIQVYHTKKSAAGKNEKIDIMYNYFSGVEFKHRMEAMIESFTQVQEEMEREKRWFSTKWARQEKSMRRFFDHAHGLRGDLQGILGIGLPEIAALPEGEEDQPTG